MTMYANNKDLPIQNFIEIFPLKKNIVELSKDEALSRYKRNAYILGRIFSNDSELDENKEIQEETTKREVSDLLAEEKLMLMKKEEIETEEKHQKRLEYFRKRNKRYHELLNEAKHIKNEKQFEDLKVKLVEENFYGTDHPFLCEDSRYYLNNDEDLIKQLNPDQVDRITDYGRIDFSENFVYHTL